MILRRLISNGIEEFGRYLDLLESEPTAPVPDRILESDTESEPVAEHVEVVRNRLATRMSVARFLADLFHKAGTSGDELDQGLWSWLTLALFDSVCPSDRTGARKPRERSAYIPEKDNYRRYYRHLLLGPYLIYRAHQDDPARAMGLLCRPPHIIDDVVAQIAARQEYVTNPAIVELVTELYYDPKLKALRRGAGSKGPGSARRLVNVLGQFDVTWDLYATSGSEFRQLLPKEFTKYLVK